MYIKIDLRMRRLLKDFFENLGFSVERHSFLEVMGELTSPEKLDISPQEAEKMIEPAVVFVMRLASSK